MTDEQSLTEEFARCAPWLMAALDYNGLECGLSDVYDGIKSGAYALMGGKASALVLEPVTHPSGKRVLNFFLAGGDLQELQEMERQVCQWARFEGYDSVAIFGRRGWLKRLDGYTEQAVYMEKKI